LHSALLSKRGIIFYLTFFVLAISKLCATQEDLEHLQNNPIQTEKPWIISADFLFWLASEEIASIWADVITVGDNTSSWGVPSFDFKWNYGFRLGMGYNLPYDQWDTILCWTWFRTETTNSLFASSLSLLQPEFFAAFLSGDYPNSMTCKWSLLLNMFDWELGRNFWTSKRLSLRPFLGIKGGWINQSIDTDYNNFIINEQITQNSGTEHVKNNFWGIGPLGGINSKWKIYGFDSNFFDLFGDFSAAAMWGTWIRGDNYKNTLAKTSSINLNNSSLGELMFRGFMGMGWDIKSKRLHFAAKIGYEMQLWLDQLRLATFQLQCLHNDLTLQGLTFNCRFDF